MREFYFLQDYCDDDEQGDHPLMHHNGYVMETQLALGMHPEESMMTFVVRFPH